LIDGGIAIVTHLIAIVFELLSEWTELGPSFVARRARHTVLTSEGRNRGRGVTVNKSKEKNEQEESGAETAKGALDRLRAQAIHASS